MQKHLDLQKEHFDLRKVKVAGKLENPLKLRLVRRDIARIQTVLTALREGGHVARRER